MAIQINNFVHRQLHTFVHCQLLHTNSILQNGKDHGWLINLLLSPPGTSLWSLLDKGFLLTLHNGMNYPTMSNFCKECTQYPNSAPNGNITSVSRPLSDCQQGPRRRLALFPGLHAQLLSLAVRKAGEGLDGLIT